MTSPSPFWKRAAWTALLLATVAPSCGKNKPTGSGTGGNPGSGGAMIPGSGGQTGTGGAGGAASRACLDRPDELPRPPSGGLPCELIPPGTTL